MAQTRCGTTDLRPVPLGFSAMASFGTLLSRLLHEVLLRFGRSMHDYLR